MGTASTASCARRRAATYLVAAAVVLPAHRAVARQFSTFIDIRTEEDLYDLLAAGMLDADTTDQLAELLQRRIDINHSSRETIFQLPNLNYGDVDRILAHREHAGAFADLSDLIASNAIDRRKVESLEPFLMFSQASKRTAPVRGSVRVRARTAGAARPSAPGDAFLFPVAVQARVVSRQAVQAGLLALLSNRELRDVRFDPSRNQLSAPTPRTRVALRKGFLWWRTAKFEALVGSYRVGFAQRLVFDSTDLSEPNGFYGDSQLHYSNRLGRKCRESAGERTETPCSTTPTQDYTVPDYQPRPRQLGVAGTARRFPLGPGLADLHAFASHQPHSIYQYELFDAGACADPHNDGLPQCRAPRVFRRQSDVTAPTTVFNFSTLESMYTETLAGFHGRYHAGVHTSLGITGYHARVHWLTEGIDLDFQEWSRRPYGGDYGALGVDARTRLGNSDLRVEGARSFDSMPRSGGGLAVVAESVTPLGKGELQSSGRYYAPTYANPHAGSLAQADEVDGLRTQNEVGVRVRYAGSVGRDLEVRTDVDIWRPASKTSAGSGSQAQTGLLGIDYAIRRYARTGLQSRYRRRCFAASAASPPCTSSVTAVANWRLDLSRTTWLQVQYRHTWHRNADVDASAGVDSPAETDRQDPSFWAAMATRPTPSTGLKIRARYVDEHRADVVRGERSLWIYGSSEFQLRERDRMQVRVDWRNFLDRRPSTLQRYPNPELWLWFDYEVSF